MSIYLTDGLKAQVDDLKSINWSHIAQAAFESELRYHVKRSESRMSAVIERLRRSKKEQTDVQTQRGMECGRTWAEEDASFLDLKAIGENFNPDEDPESIGPAFLINWLEDGAQGNRDFWDRVSNTDDELSTYWKFGFAQGAAQVWSEVRDEI